MRIIDNVNELLGDDLKSEVRPGSKLRIAASTFPIFAFEALRKELERVEESEFVFTSPSFVAANATDQLPKERRRVLHPHGTRRGILALRLAIRDPVAKPVDTARYRAGVRGVDAAQDRLPLQSERGADATVRRRGRPGRVPATPRIHLR